jgi:hypothetical protein
LTKRRRRRRELSSTTTTAVTGKNSDGNYDFQSDLQTGSVFGYVA